MNKLNSNQTKIVVLILSVAVLIVAFRFGFTPIMDKVSQVKTENSELSAKVKELTGVKNYETKIRADLDFAVKGIQITSESYSAGITPQKTIVMLRDLEDFADLKVQSASFNEMENFYTSTFTTETGENVMGYKSTVNIKYETSYEGLKKAMDFINTYTERMNVDSFTVAYNQETGILMGDMNINMYALTGLGRKYEEPQMGGFEMSLDNIFGSVN